MTPDARAPSESGGDGIPLAHAAVYPWIVRTSAAVVCLIAGLTLVGWTFGVDVLRSGRPGLFPMTPLTAVGLLLAGGALASLARRRRSRGAVLVERILAVAVALLGALTLVEYAFGIHFGTDGLLFPDAVRSVGGRYPGRPAVRSGVAFVLAGFALRALPSMARGRATAAQLSALGVLVAATLALTGYAYGAEQVYAFDPAAPMSLPAAVAFSVLAVGILVARPEAGVVAILTGDDMGGFVARRLLPVAIFVPFFLGWVRLLGERAGLFGVEIGLTLVTVAAMISLVGVIWWSAGVVRRLDGDRRRAEAAVREGEMRLLTALEVLPIGVWFTDLAGRIVYGNPAGRRIWGGARYVPPEEYGEYRGWWPDTGKRIGAHEWALARALERRETSIGEEVEIEAFDGTRKLIRNSALPLIGPDGVLHGAVVVNEDITARKRAERERERSRADAERRAREEEALRRAAEAVSGAFTVEDVIARIAESALAATGASIALVGRIDTERNEVVVVGGAGAHGLPLGTRVPYPGSLTERVIEGGAPVMISRLGDDPGIPRILVRICEECAALAVPMEASGEAIGALILLAAAGRPAFTSDEADRATAFARLASLAFSKVHLLEEAEHGRRELERLLESQSRLVRGFSHDVKNPLGAADGRLALLEEGVLDGLSRRQLEELSHVRRSIGTALRLIDSLVEFARAEAGQVTIRPTAVDVRSIAREIAEEYRPSAESKGLSVAIELPETLPTIRSDPDRVRQILGNLVSNGVKYTDAGEIRIRVVPREGGRAPGPGRWICVDVADTGPGIPEDRRDELFGEFTRLEPGKGRGAGLGLAISRRLARMLGGDITLESAVGEGSTFTLWLPADGAPRAAARAAADGGTPSEAAGPPASWYGDGAAARPGAGSGAARDPGAHDAGPARERPG